ncbi:MAG TPA: diaminopimelate decarboxylase [Planctomycetota bacterium]|nr:diaminopimelate decarboxylase [Planctomycetota bacterium]
MDSFAYRNGKLCCEDIAAADLAAKFGTPLYVYSRATLLDHLGKIQAAFAKAEPVICYSVKANSNLSLLQALAGAGSGFDVVSGGELFRVQKAGGDPGKVVYAGVGKTARELDEAMAAGILLFNCESEPELDALQAAAKRAGRKARVALRINPDVKAGGHAKISTGHKATKFGLAPDRAAAMLKRAASWPDLVFDGVHVHIGSQILKPEPYVAALDRTVEFIKGNRSKTAPLSWLDSGGGFGVFYKAEDEAAGAAAFAEVIVPRAQSAGCRLVLEPGRFIVGNAGILLARLLYVKDSGSKRYYVVDAGMNDLIRPSLYEAFHEVWPAESNLLPPSRGGKPDGATLRVADVVGPICESGDYLALGRALPEMAAGDLVAVFTAGAYGFAMSSNYNSRPRAAEVLVTGKTAKLARRRESYESLIAGETD